MNSLSPKRIYVDLDGTLLRTDSLWESLLLLLKAHPYKIVVLPWWLIHGRALFKKKVAEQSELDPALLSYHEGLLAYLTAERAQGATLILATAADQKIARRVADHFGIFDAVLASDGTTNLSGEKKRDAILAHAHGEPFAYIGNAAIDRIIWKYAALSHVVATELAANRLLADIPAKGIIVPVEGTRPKDILEALRVRQWPKNLLIFLPLVLSHHVLNFPLLKENLLGFFALSLVASCMYILNDLFDLSSDRRHQTKRLRSLASGRLSISMGILCALLCLAGGIALSAMTRSLGFLLLLFGYMLVSFAYSWRIKRIAVLDVIVLSSLYVVRIYMGSTLTGIPVSAWLAAFALFSFLGLAILKRVVELDHIDRTGGSGRGYRTEDTHTMRLLGIGSSFLSLVIFAQYLYSSEVTVLYRTPMVLWGALGVLLWWNIRIWLFASRGKIPEDPIAHTLKDPGSYIAAAILVILFLVAM